MCVADILLYLSDYICPRITYAINCFVRYMFEPKLSHERALKRICRYLKNTCNCGLIIQPIMGAINSLKIDCYPDADFTVLYSHKKYDDLTCVKSQTGFMITVNDAPIVSKSSFQRIRGARSNFKAHTFKTDAFLYVAPLHKSTSYRGELQMLLHQTLHVFI